MNYVSRIAFMVNGTLPVIDSTRKLKLEHGRKVVRVTCRAVTALNTSDFDLKESMRKPPVPGTDRKKEILTIHTLEASLEDIFIKVTGHQLIA